MQNTITCPYCKKGFELDQVFRHQVEEDIKKKTEAELAKKFEEKGRLELQDLQKQLEEQKKKNDEFKEQELRLREEKRLLEEKEKDLDLKLERQLDEERKKIAEKVGQDKDNEYRLKLKEKEEEKESLKRKIEDLNRKATMTGSQQLQGEVLELDFENSLKEAFPTDDIIPVGKGVKGADIKQIVKTQRGTTCGVILWETKRTKTWDNDWPNKLKNELRIEKANVPIIVTEAFPKEITAKMGTINGVWVIDYSLTIVIANLMRQRLIDIAREKYLIQNRSKDNQEQVYDYIVSREYGQELDAILEVYSSMIDQVNKEKAAFEKQWKMRIEIADKLLKSRGRIAGTLQMKLGQNTTLQIKDVGLLEDAIDNE